MTAGDTCVDYMTTTSIVNHHSCNVNKLRCQNVLAHIMHMLIIATNHSIWTSLGMPEQNWYQ